MIAITNVRRGEHISKDDFKSAKHIASLYGFTGLKKFKSVDKDTVEAESIHTGKRVRVNVSTEQVYEFDNLYREFLEVD